MTAKRFLVAKMLEPEFVRHAGPPKRYFAGAPTRTQARDIFWEDLKALIPRHLMAGPPRETDLEITMLAGTQLRVVGLDVPARVEGVPWDGCMIDEFPNVKPGAWKNNIRPMLGERNGWAWIFGVPDRDQPNQVDYQELHDRAATGLDPDWRAYNWPSSDILPPSEIELLKRELDEATYRQEMKGEFVSASSIAFPDFSLQENVGIVSYTPTLPLCWSLDFNVSPMASLMIQHLNGQVRVLSEVCPEGKSTTYDACEAFNEWVVKNNADPTEVCIYGDASGAARDSTSTQTDWSIIRTHQHLKNRNPRVKVPSKNPYIKDTVNAVRARICNAAGEINLIVHPSCKRLIRELQTLPWPGDLESGHFTAALRYFCEREYRVSAKREVEAGQFSVTVQ